MNDEGAQVENEESEENDDEDEQQSSATGDNDAFAMTESSAMAVGISVASVFTACIVCLVLGCMLFSRLEKSGISPDDVKRSMPARADSQQVVNISIKRKQAPPVHALHISSFFNHQMVVPMHNVVSSSRNDISIDAARESDDDVIADNEHRTMFGLASAAVDSVDAIICNDEEVIGDDQLATQGDDHDSDEEVTIYFQPFVKNN